MSANIAGALAIVLEILYDLTNCFIAASNIAVIIYFWKNPIKSNSFKVPKACFVLLLLLLFPKKTRPSEATSMLLPQFWHVRLVHAGRRTGCFIYPIFLINKIYYLNEMLWFNFLFLFFRHSFFCDIVDAISRAIVMLKFSYVLVGFYFLCYLFFSF